MRVDYFNFLVVLIDGKQDNATPLLYVYFVLLS